MSIADPKLANLGSRIDLRKATILLMDANAQGMEVLSQMFMGFGASNLLRATSFEEGQQVAHGHAIDLIVAEAVLQPGEADGYEFMSWLRRSGLEPNMFAPAILLSSHTSRRNVDRARDCGAHFVISKPLAPAVLLDRILWIAQTNRTFISCDVYAGPERRFQNLGPPDGIGRRERDLPPEVGEAAGENMSQDEIDSLLPSKKAAQ